MEQDISGAKLKKVEESGRKLNNIKGPKLTTTNLKNIVHTTLNSLKHIQNSFLIKLSKRKASSDHYGLDFLGGFSALQLNDFGYNFKT